jgi:uncharacterized protein
MEISDLSSLNSQILLFAFLLSMALGAIAQKTHFCTMGAVSDVLNMGDWTRMRQWALAIGVAMSGFAMLSYFGQIDASKTIHANNRWIWLSALLGGVMFGFGMVLASGCGSKTLVRVGTGSLKSLIVMLVMGIAAFATLKGLTAVARVATVDTVAVEFPHVANLSYLAASLFDSDAKLMALVLGLGLGGVLMVWALVGAAFFRFDNLLAGLGIGSLVVAMWWVSGHVGFVEEHPVTLESVYLATNSGRIESLSFVAPIAYLLDWLLLFSDKSKALTVGIVSVLGVIVGSFVSARLTRTFRWEGFGNVEDVANHLVGGLLMGVGGVTAMGCTVGQGLTGLSTLGLTSIVAFASILGGAVLAFRYQIWRLDAQG